MIGIGLAVIPLCDYLFRGDETPLAIYLQVRHLRSHSSPKEHQQMFRKGAYSSPVVLQLSLCSSELHVRFNDYYESNSVSGDHQCASYFHPLPHSNLPSTYPVIDYCESCSSSHRLNPARCLKFLLNGSVCRLDYEFVSQPSPL